MSSSSQRLLPSCLPSPTFHACTLPLTWSASVAELQAQCQHLTTKYHIYLSPDGRISLGGLPGELINRHPCWSSHAGPNHLASTTHPPGALPDFQPAMPATPACQTQALSMFAFPWFRPACSCQVPVRSRGHQRRNRVLPGQLTRGRPFVIAVKQMIQRLPHNIKPWLQFICFATEMHD